MAGPDLSTVVRLFSPRHPPGRARDQNRSRGRRGGGGSRAASGLRFDVFHHLGRMEWDTLLFFYGVVIAVGGLNFIGYLQNLSGYLYSELGATPPTS